MMQVGMVSKQVGVLVVQMIDMLGPKALRHCSWHSGTKGMLSALLCSRAGARC